MWSWWLLLWFACPQRHHTCDCSENKSDTRSHKPKRWTRQIQCRAAVNTSIRNHQLWMQEKDRLVIYIMPTVSVTSTWWMWLCAVRDGRFRTTWSDTKNLNRTFVILELLIIVFWADHTGCKKSPRPPPCYFELCSFWLQFRLHIG
jgi:hypothetical protein